MREEPAEHSCALCLDYDDMDACCVSPTALPREAATFTQDELSANLCPDYLPKGPSWKK